MSHRPEQAGRLQQEALGAYISPAHQRAAEEVQGLHPHPVTPTLVFLVEVRPRVAAPLGIGGMAGSA
jgi:hypothetical protein